MGDRANYGFVMNSGDDIMYLYCHNIGEHMVKRLAKCLVKAKDSWQKPAYASRIVVSNIIETSWSQNFNYGFTVNHILDNAHSIPVVNFYNSTVTLYKKDSPINDPDVNLAKYKIYEMSLEQFAEKYGK
jgi:hypothetical protein